MVPKCLGSEVSWVRSVLTPVQRVWVMRKCAKSWHMRQPDCQTYSKRVIFIAVSADNVRFPWLEQLGIRLQTEKKQKFFATEILLKQIRSCWRSIGTYYWNSTVWFHFTRSKSKIRDDKNNIDNNLTSGACRAVQFRSSKCGGRVNRHSLIVRRIRTSYRVSTSITVFVRTVAWKGHTLQFTAVTSTIRNFDVDKLSGHHVHVTKKMRLCEMRVFLYLLVLVLVLVDDGP